MYVIAVQFLIAPENTAAFKAAVLPNAAASVQTEPGCRQFDVCFSDNETKCFLYEVYDDEAAFGAHRASAHYQTFSAAIAGKVLDKRLEIYTRPVNPYIQ